MNNIAHIEPRVNPVREQTLRKQYQTEAFRLRLVAENLRGRLRRVIQIAKEDRLSGLSLIEEGLALEGRVQRLERELAAAKKGRARRDAQIASLLNETNCVKCGELVENCWDSQTCGRCEECFAFPEDCKCASRCRWCRGWKCRAKECAREEREDEDLNRGRDL